MQEDIRCLAKNVPPFPFGFWFGRLGGHPGYWPFFGTSRHIRLSGEHFKTWPKYVLIDEHNVILFPPSCSQCFVDIASINLSKGMGNVDLPPPNCYAVTSSGGQENEYDDLDRRVVKGNRFLECSVHRSLKLVECQPVERTLVGRFGWRIIGICNECTAFP
jgi:hypothetical protein